MGKVPNWRRLSGEKERKGKEIHEKIRLFRAGRLEYPTELYYCTRVQRGPTLLQPQIGMFLAAVSLSIRADFT